MANLAYGAFPLTTNTILYPQEKICSAFNLGGFALGLLLGIYGVIIAYLIKKKDVIKSSWWGFGTRCAIGIALVVAFLYYNGGLNLY